MSNGGKYNHIVFTDRDNVPDMKTVPGTMLISEIHGNRDTSEPKILSARLPCACQPCRKNVMNAPQKCEYKSIRSIKEQFFIQNRNKDDDPEDDPLGLQSLPVAELKSELAARGLTKGGNKPVLLHDYRNRFQATMENPKITTKKRKTQTRTTTTMIRMKFRPLKNS